MRFHMVASHSGPQIRPTEPERRRPDMIHQTRYRTHVHVRGELSPAWSVLFADLTVSTAPDGTTSISGVLPDEAALHGLLATVRDLGLSVISVESAALPGTTPATEGR
jgi:hypothetical protein